MAIVYRRNSSSHLLVFFNGWGADENIIPPHNTMDMCILYEWQNIKKIPFEEWKSYERITVVAWSLGIVEANAFLQETSLKNIHKTIAINGSPMFIDDKKGIQKKIFNATLEGLSPTNVKKFQQRMWHSAKTYNENPHLHSQRCFESIKEELLYFSKKENSSSGTKLWNIAIIGKNDLIFPPKNLREYWKNRETQIVEFQNLPHYPFTQNFSWKDFL